MTVKPTRPIVVLEDGGKRVVIDGRNRRNRFLESRDRDILDAIIVRRTTSL